MLVKGLNKPIRRGTIQDGKIKKYNTKRFELARESVESPICLILEGPSATQSESERDACMLKMSEHHLLYGVGAAVGCSKDRIDQQQKSPTRVYKNLLLYVVALLSILVRTLFTLTHIPVVFVFGPCRDRHNTLQIHLAV